MFPTAERSGQSVHGALHDASRVRSSGLWRCRAPQSSATELTFGRRCWRRARKPLVVQTSRCEEAVAMLLGIVVAGRIEVVATTHWAVVKESMH